MFVLPLTVTIYIKYDIFIEFLIIIFAKIDMLIARVTYLYLEIASFIVFKMAMAAILNNGGHFKCSCCPYSLSERACLKVHYLCQRICLFHILNESYNILNIPNIPCEIEQNTF
jgi:hypothetical protein